MTSVNRTTQEASRPQGCKRLTSEGRRTQRGLASIEALKFSGPSSPRFAI